MSLSSHFVSYTFLVPRLWNETIEAHREDVRDAIVRATMELVERDGVLSITMSRIADQTGIGRATLYKYFPDVRSIVQAWHERQIAHHLDHLTHAAERATDPGERLRSVLDAYAALVHASRSHPATELAWSLHHGGHVARAERHLRDLLTRLLRDARATGTVRDDMAPGELAAFCLHALGAARDAGSKAAVQRLVNAVWDAIGDE